MITIKNSESKSSSSQVITTSVSFNADILVTNELQQRSSFQITVHKLTLAVFICSTWNHQIVEINVDFLSPALGPATTALAKSDLS